jgi:hypothetical protein
MIANWSLGMFIENHSTNLMVEKHDAGREQYQQEEAAYFHCD